MSDETTRARLEELRAELRAERISYGELAELQDLAKHIDPSDFELLEAAGVPEFPAATVQSLATEAHSYFETAAREDGSRFVRTRSDVPGWVQDLTRDAHADMLPDDWRYARIAEALEVIAEADDVDDARHEFSDAAVDVYTSARIEWLGSHLARASYCDEAARELGTGPDGPDVVGMIGLGQYFEADEIYGSVLRALEQRAQDLAHSE